MYRNHHYRGRKSICTRRKRSFGYGSPVPISSWNNPDGKTIWTYKDALFSTSIPKKLLIIGAGVIGLEFGSFYQALGTEVTLVERQGEILQSQDHEIMQYALKEYKNLGMKFLLNHQFQTLKSKDPLEVALISSEGKESIWRGDKLFLATGIVGNHENLGLEMTQAKIDRTHVCVNSVSKTDEKGFMQSEI